MVTGKSVEVKKSVPVVCEVDVLVVGSGIAGSTAALTAAKEGARTYGGRSLWVSWGKHGTRLNC